MSSNSNATINKLNSMKNLLLYIAVTMVYSLAMNSCVEGDLQTIPMPHDTTHVELSISMNALGGCTYQRTGSSTVSPDQQEEGLAYERTIIGVEDIEIQIFDASTHEYRGSLSNLSMTGVPDAPVRVVSGELPQGLIGQEIYMVFKANYNRRLETQGNPADGYTAWTNGSTFNYGRVVWSAEDKKYIPMSGACSFTVQPDNYQTIDLTRAVAKVRVRMAESCTQYKLTSLKAINANSLSYSLQHQAPIAKFDNGLTDVLTFPNLDITAQNKNAHEFYLPEQANKDDKPTTLQIGLTPIEPGSAEILKDNIDFRYYPDGNLYDIARNYIYEFVVNKKADEAKADIQVTIMPWTTHDISSDYE